MIPFVKGHGLGNDYIVINGADLPVAAHAAADRCASAIATGAWAPTASCSSCRRGPAADFGLRILNPDGSEAEKSGNGLRIFAKYLWDHGHAKRDDLHGGHQGRARGVPLPRGRTGA